MAELAARVEPDQAVLEPMRVVALGVVLARVPSPALGALRRGGDGAERLGQEVVELERLHKVAVPDERAVAHLEVGPLLPAFVELLEALREDGAGAEDGTVALHRALHLEAQLGGRRRAVGVAQTVEAGHGRLSRTLG